MRTFLNIILLPPVLLFVVGFLVLCGVALLMTSD